VIEEIASENTAEDVLHGFYDEAAALIRGLRNKEPLRPTIEEVFPSVELCLKLVEMAGQEAGGVASVKS
jgi:hypothetical protein